MKLRISGCANQEEKLAFAEKCGKWQQESRGDRK